METEEIIVRWTARLVVVCYLIRLLYDLRSWPLHSLTERRVLIIWGVGLLIYWLHVAAAFAWIHDWSHQAAWQHTAEQTARLTGWHWGGGVWINYLFGLLWAGDFAVACRYGIASLSTCYRIAMHAFFGFIVFNATVVFGPWGWWIVAVLIAVHLILIRRSVGKDPATTVPGSPK